MKQYNAKGISCPGPLILAKKGLKEIETGDEFEILIDNETSYKNVISFLKDNHAGFTVSKEGIVYTLVVRKQEDNLAKPDTKEYCELQVEATTSSLEFESFAIEEEEKADNLKLAKKHVISISSTSIAAADELGDILLKGFVSTVKEVDPLPSAVILYHEAAKLAAEGSPVLEDLKELENLNVKILICGTCSDYYKLTEKIKVGIVSNAYSILEALTNASHVLKL